MFRLSRFPQQRATAHADAIMTWGFQDEVHGCHHDLFHKYTVPASQITRGMFETCEYIPIHRIWQDGFMAGVAYGTGDAHSSGHQISPFSSGVRFVFFVFVILVQLVSKGRLCYAYVKDENRLKLIVVLPFWYLVLHVFRLGEKLRQETPQQWKMMPTNLLDTNGSHMQSI